MRGRRKGELETLYFLSRDGVITLKEAAARKNMTEKEFMNELKKPGPDPEKVI